MLSENVSKQILERYLMTKFCPGHRCKTSMRSLAEKTTSKSADNLFYTFKDSEYKLFKVLKVMDTNEVYAQELNVAKKVFARHPELPFGSVGVFEDHGVLTIKKVIPMTEVAGKLVKIRNLYMTAPRNVLTEK